MAGSADGTSGYRLVCNIAKGGMGRVELVVRADADFARLYARKRLLKSLVDDEQSRAMFRDEARIAGMLRHPNVVGVYDVGEDDEGLYLLMDYVEGVPLSRMIERARTLGEPLPIQATVHVLKQVAEGLHAAHELRGLDGQAMALVHRDVSPSNILVDLSGVVRVADFGIARAVGRRAKTSTGLLKGKVGYMAPELLRFDKPDRRADLYSLGVVLYEMLSGRRLYKGGDISDVAKMILNDPPPDLGAERNDVPDALVELGFELLAKDPDLRPATAREVSLRLDEVMQELLLMEDPLSFEDYVRAKVDARRISARRERAEEVRRAILSGEPVSSDEPTTDTERLDRRRPARARSGIWLGLAAVLLLGAGSALGFVLSRRGAADAPVVDAEPVGAVAPEVADDPAVETGAGTFSEGDAQEAEANRAATPTMRRRPRRNMRRSMMNTTEDMAAAMDEGIEPWGWE